MSRLPGIHGQPPSPGGRGRGTRVAGEGEASTPCLAIGDELASPSPSPSGRGPFPLPQGEGQEAGRSARYAELQVTTNFSFLRGASHPDELVLAAAALGHSAVAVTDRNTLAGVVRAHSAAKQIGIRLVVGVRLDLRDAPSLLCFPTDRAAYGRLCRLLTLGNRRAPKGECHLDRADLAEFAAGQVAVALPPADPNDVFIQYIKELRSIFDAGCYLAASHLHRGDDARRLHRLAAIAESAGTPLVATNDVHYHAPDRRPLQDVLTCIREHCTIDGAGWRLFANAERHMKPPEEMAALFRRYPDAVARTVEIAERCHFSLDELRYEYPVDPVPEGGTPQSEMERLTWIGAGERYPEGIPPKVRAQIEHEFELIAQLGYAPYFLTVHDIVGFARSRGILCQGRGSAANSAVCFCLGITSVDPARGDLLFERFVSAARNEPPDIDVDFEHERREEVIQYIYGKYGRERAGLAATVITYRSRSAIRDVGKALGLSEDVVGALAGTVWGHSRDPVAQRHIREIGLDPDEPRLRLALDLAQEILGFPRHLSQHVGGFVMTKGRLDEVVPVANAAMAERTVIEWDKDDLDALGILKVDVLALGMLTCVRKGFDLLRTHHGVAVDLATVPAEDPAVYDMLCKADSLGVFQVESRAQMTMLPRLLPRTFYDLVIEVAIVRPGPIQGDMVHPYLRRRMGKEPVTFPSEAMRNVLGKTMGVPLFQEQAMRIAIEAAGFTPVEADRLRRAMATFRRSGTIQTFRDKFINGMRERGYDIDFAERCFKQIEGFGEYGFPESHAASFALLVYVSAWLKCHYPAAFACALLNSQPMGFYAPAQIVRDARAHGVEVRPVDVNHSDWDCTLEPGRHGPALRLGFRQVKGLAERDARRIAAARGAGYEDVGEMWRRCKESSVIASRRRSNPAVPSLWIASSASPPRNDAPPIPRQALETLAKADAFGSLGLDRRHALWAIRGLPDDHPLPLFAAGEDREEEGVRLLPPAIGEQVLEDYSSLRMTLRQHPLALLRADLQRQGIVPASRLASARGKVRVAGLVTVRQRPGSAKGVIFLTMEDETGVANVVVWPQTFEAYRREVLRASLLCVEGKVQRDGKDGIVIHVVADRLEDHTWRLAALAGDGGQAVRLASRDFH
ncbi:MAG: error-prone DNA polymerase [Rhodospirillales bacterium]|nr:error-prone DNA polymerase [Rhodospirillales bacterium]